VLIEPSEGSLQDHDLDSRIAELELELKSTQAQLRIIKSQLRVIEKRSISSWISSKFKPRIFQFEQYDPRPLRVPSDYGNSNSSKGRLRIAMVTPSLNHARYIRSTLDSVVGQNYPLLSYHVQDGGSRDGSLAILSEYNGRLNWESAEDSGQSEAINRGFAKLDGDIMAYLNSDDILLPGSLAYVEKYFSEHPDVDVIYGHRISIDSNGLEIGRSILPTHDAEVIKWCDFIPQETMFWRRRVWDTLGGIDQRFQYAMDWDFILRAHERGFRFVRVPRFIGAFRVHHLQKTFKWIDIGEAESRQLRVRSLGRIPTSLEIERAISGYMRRHVLQHRLYKLNIVKY
jgi:glycosyltransferase involved in cell wall biosynthesis